MQPKKDEGPAHRATGAGANSKGDKAANITATAATAQAKGRAKRRRPDLPFTIEMLGRNAFRVIRRNRTTMFECNARVLATFLREAGITPDQRRALFEEALARMRERGRP